MINEIKKARAMLLTEEQKAFIKKYLKRELTYKPYAIIEGAKHFKNEWVLRDEPKRNFMQCRVPFQYHTAISDWLRSLGFNTDRYYNNGGVDNGLKVWI